MDTRTWVARNLAAAFLSNAWAPQAMEDAARAALQPSAPLDWLPSLISEIVERTETSYPPSPRALTRAILSANPFTDPRSHNWKQFLAGRSVTSAPEFAPAPAFQDLKIPRLTTLGTMSEWLNLPFSQIEWLADVKGFRALTGKETTRSYNYHWLPKRHGPPRLIEAPKPILKSIQRQILRDILNQVSVHDCAHGFRKGRSCLTAAHLHAGEHVVATLDLKDFFLRIPVGRIHGLFRSLGYPWSVARYLTGLCTTRTSREVLKQIPSGMTLDRETEMTFQQRHLPQGAPSSPSLANLAAWRLDRRLEAVSKHMDSYYTRYGDDLAFSGGSAFAQQMDKWLRSVAAICVEEGFTVNHRKTKIMRHGSRQQLTGVIVNQHVNIPRATYDRLKATLYNCRRDGPASQNRAEHPDFRAHLDGKITWVENVNPWKGRRLRWLFQQIDWS